jgi:hypothetical protein
LSAAVTALPSTTRSNFSMSVAVLAPVGPMSVRVENCPGLL